MTDNRSERALLAILALELEEGLDKDTQTFAEAPMPALDARVEKYLRAMSEGDSDAGDPAKARELILAAMAKDLANRGEGNGEHRGSFLFKPLARRFSRAHKPASRGIRQAAPTRRTRAIQRIGTFAASAAAILVVGWTGAWFYAQHSVNTAIAEWRSWEDKSGRQYSCATEGYGGTPFRVEMICSSAKATIITETGKFAAEAKQLRVAVNLFRPGVIVSKVEGPVTFAELGKPDRIAGRWSYAEATVIGPRPTPDGLSIELANFEVDRVTEQGTEPLARAEHVAFRARLDPIATVATKKPAYDLTSDITAGSLPSGPPMVARPFEMRMKAVLHGVGDMTPKPLPARIKGWQRNGGLVEMTSVEIRGIAADANARGTLTLSEQGGFEGVLDLSGEHYDRLLEALTGKPPEFATRRLTEGATKPQPSQTERRALPALRFEDGAVYFGSAPLGRLPALF
ncbi:MAG TPA: DUF2125 domain-containing protein [Methylocella sp.]|jgi:hypothetical protein